MKIVDQTPYYKENSELSFTDRVRAILEFGPDWFKEVEALRTVIAVLKKNLDKNYTLLCNVIPPGVNARFPLILVGPTGVYVMYVTPKMGMFRARGDQWGTISGNSLKPEKPNLLTRTERMAHAIHVFLQRQGYLNLNGVEAVLLCSDPITNVDSMRPIIRVIMRDTFERFAVSIAQARLVLNQESVNDIVNRLLNPPPPPPSKSDKTLTSAVPVDLSLQGSGPSIPAIALPGSTGAPIPPSQGSDQSNSAIDLPGSAAVPASIGVSLPPLPDTDSTTPPSPAPRSRLRFNFTRRQIAILVGMAVIWILIVIVFAFLIVRNLNPSLFMLR